MAFLNFVRFVTFVVNEMVVHEPPQTQIQLIFFHGFSI
jgi:hypothetical protein